MTEKIEEEKKKSSKFNEKEGAIFQDLNGKAREIFGIEVER